MIKTEITGQQKNDKLC